MFDVLGAIGDYFTQNLGTDLFDKTANLIGKASPLFAAGFSLYLMLIIWGYYRNGFDESISDFLKKMLGWLVIIALAFNVDNYMSIAKLAYDFPDELTSWLAGTEVNANAAATISNQIKEMVAALDVLAKKAYWYEMQTQVMVVIAKFVVYVFGSVLASFAFFFYLLAKVNLALILLLGPIFIGAMLFPATRQYGMNWIGQILNYSVTICLYAVVFILQTSFIENQLAKWAANDSGIPNMNVVGAYEVMGTIVLLSIIFLMVLFSIPSIASALTGGAAIDSHRRAIAAVASTVTGGITKGRRLLRAGKNSMKG
ncbi:type IV secretion system protein [Oligella urethralis]|uniref:type IV secretion system protein n=1 Tax=Oligella urethralis TaxID=90245 RepID=UPI002431CE43|nr:type IV secretion system protein [Oligella urethralis]